MAVDRTRGTDKHALLLFQVPSLAPLHVLDVIGDWTAVAVRDLPSGQCEMYVAGFHTNEVCVWVLTKHPECLTLARRFGGEMLRGPQMIAMFQDEVFVTECHAGRVSVFSLEGQLHRQWTHPWLTDPDGIVVTAHGEVVITDFLTRDVCVFDVLGRPLSHWSTKEMCAATRPWHVISCSEHCVAVSSISYTEGARVDLFRLFDGQWVGCCFRSPRMHIQSLTSSMGLALVSPNTLVVAFPNMK